MFASSGHFSILELTFILRYIDKRLIFLNKTKMYRNMTGKCNKCAEYLIAKCNLKNYIDVKFWNIEH